MPLTDSVSLSLPQTRTTSLSLTPDVTGSPTLSLSRTLIPTETYSVTVSLIPTDTASISSTADLTFSQSLSRTASVTAEDTLSKSISESLSDSPSITDSVSESITNTRGSDSMSNSHELTTSALPPTTTPVPTPSRTLMTRCPDSCEFGVCNNKYPFKCICFEKAQYGFWAGSDFGGPCVECKKGYFGKTCMLPCPGGACSTCSGHGVCDDGKTGTGTCTCTNSTRTGYWKGLSCSQCLDNYYGNNCDKPCDCYGPGTLSCDFGRGKSGKCNCKVGWSSSRCDVCDPREVTDCKSHKVCPGPPGAECNLHGDCIVTGDVAECRCFDFFAGIDCGLECPLQCSGRGTCSSGKSGTGKCTCTTRWAEPDCSTCRHGYWGTSCENSCPGGATRPCNNSGTCSSITGLCRCSGTFGGSECTIPCPRGANGDVCSGHGTCNSDTLTCTCFTDSARGFWTGGLCSMCASTHGGASCATACPVFNGTVCSGFGDCDNVTAKCVCKDNHCGKFCDVTIDSNGDCLSCPRRGLYGPSCDRECLCDTAHSNCTDGQSGDGSCDCFFGWSGRYCNQSCPGGAGNPCSGHGVCDPVNRTCTCAVGYGTSDCSVGCVLPGCNGHGRCDDGATGSGKCICNETWGWPETGCSSFCNCNNHGTCALHNLTCECAPRFTGARCERCVDGLAGGDCNVTCVNGATNGTQCACRFGWAGEGCDAACPVGSNREVCSGNGECLKSGKCKCTVPGTKGPTCGCTDAYCRGINDLTQCSDLTGECVCQSGRASSAGKTDCALCTSGYWGAACTEPCDCSRRGSCDKETGACSCYASATTGYWGGAKCDACLGGFMGAACQQKSVSTTVMPSLVAPHSATVTAYYYSLDKQRNLYFAGGQAINAMFNITTIARVTQTASVQTPCSDGGGDVFGLWPLNNGSLLYLMVANTTCKDVSPALWSGPEDYFLRNRTFAQPLTSSSAVKFDPTIPLVFIPKQQDICFVIDSAIQLICRNIVNLAEVQYVPSQDTLFKNVRVLTTNENTPGGVIFAGNDARSRCAMELAAVNASSGRSTGGKVDVTEQMARMGYSCLSIDCAAAAANNHIIFGALTASGGVLAALNLATMKLTNADIVSSSFSSRCNAIAHDRLSNIGLVTFFSTLIKFRFADVVQNGSSVPVHGVQPYGQQVLSSSLIRKFDVFEEQQIAFAPLRTARGVEVMRFLLVDVESVSPLVIDRRGGAVVTVTGAGFRNVSTAFCKFGTDAVKATYVSPTQIQCIAPASLSTKTCVTQILEVTMNNVTYTTNQQTVDRPTSVQLTGIEPLRITFASAAAPTTTVRKGSRLARGTRRFRTLTSAAAFSVTLKGRGFTESTTAKCKFTTDPSAGAFVILDAAYVSPIEYRCNIPAGFNTVTTPGSMMQLGLDGQIFSFAAQPFSVAGLPSGIIVTPDVVVNGSSPYVQFLNPSIVVRTVDLEGNYLDEFDTTVRQVQLSRNSLNGVALTLNGTTDYQMRNGVVALTDFWLERPNVGEAMFVVTVGAWNANFTMRLQSGALTALRVIKQPFSPLDVIQPNTLLPQTAEVQAIDSAGNIVSDADGQMIVVNLVFIDPVTGLLNITDKVIPAIPARSTGIATLSPPSVPLTFGLDYAILFRLQTDLTINVTTNFFRAGCPVTMFQVYGESQCRPCDFGQSLCNGTNKVIALWGHWRASETAITFYSCPVAKACEGGTEYGGCRHGYTGPLCNVCVDGWGKDFTRRCYECGSVTESAIAVAGLGLVFVVLLTAYTILMVQNWTAPSSRAGDCAVVLQLVVTFLQQSSLMEHFHYEWPEANERLYSSIGTVSDFRFYTILASNCFFRQIGFQDPDLSILYLCMFLLIVIVTVLAFIVLRCFPRVMLFTDATDVREETLRQFEKIRLANPDRPDYVKRETQLEEHKFLTILIVVSQIFVFFIIQSAAYYTFAVFSCRSLDYGDGWLRSFLAVDYSVDCDSGYYRAMRAGASALAVVYALILPGGIAAGIGYSRHSFSDSHHRLYTSFLTLGIRDKRWYWMSCVIVRKVLLVMALSFVSAPVDMYLFAWLGTLCTWFAHMQDAYEKKAHSRLDLVMNLDVVISANVGMAMNVLSDDVAVAALGWVVIVINAITYCVTLWEVARLWLAGRSERRDRGRERWQDENKNGSAIELQKQIEAEIDAMEEIEMEEAFRDWEQSDSNSNDNQTGNGTGMTPTTNRRGESEMAFGQETVTRSDARSDGPLSRTTADTRNFAQRRARQMSVTRAERTTDRTSARERAGGFGAFDLDDTFDEPVVAAADSKLRTKFYPPGYNPEKAKQPARRRMDDRPELHIDIDEFLHAACDGDETEMMPVTGKFGVPDRPVPQRPWLLDRKMREAGIRGQHDNLVLDRRGNVVDLDDVSLSLPSLPPLPIPEFDTSTSPRFAWEPVDDLQGRRNGSRSPPAGARPAGAGAARPTGAGAEPVLVLPRRR
jgi:hypothetical protein